MYIWQYNQTARDHLNIASGTYTIFGCIGSTCIQSQRPAKTKGWRPVACTSNPPLGWEIFWKRNADLKHMVEVIGKERDLNPAIMADPTLLRIPHRRILELQTSSTIEAAPTHCECRPVRCWLQLQGNHRWQAASSEKKFLWFWDCCISSLYHKCIR